MVHRTIKRPIIVGLAALLVLAPGTSALASGGGHRFRSGQRLGHHGGMKFRSGFTLRFHHGRFRHKKLRRQKFNLDRFHRHKRFHRLGHHLKPFIDYHPKVFLWPEGWVKTKDGFWIRDRGTGR